MMSTLPMRRRHRAPFVISGMLLGLFVINMGLRIAHIKFGADVPQFGDVGEFLTVLLCMVFFVAGLLALEQGTQAPATDESNANQGGLK
ncbi:MAG: hypothetical protein ABJC33_11865 [Betaproteobacteria bacterium]